jgi:hypothetical protein
MDIGKPNDRPRKKSLVDMGPRRAEAGSDGGRTREPSRFEQTYRAVADANTEARKVTEETAARLDSAHKNRPSGTDCREQNGWVIPDAVSRMETGLVRDDSTAETLPAGGIAAEVFDGIDAEGNLVTGDPIAEAAVMIRQSLTVIKEVFELSIQGEIEELELRDPSEGVLEQFAEILAVLKSMTGMLDEAVREGVALEVGDRCIEPAQMVVLEKRLRVETFRLQVAFEKLDIASEVNTLLARKLDQPASTGIPLASDPTGVSSHGAVVRMFEEVVNAKAEEVRAVVAKMAALAKQKHGSSTLLGVKVESSVKTLSIETNRPGADFGSLDPQVLRRLLKIDGEAEPAQGKPVVEGEGKPGGQVKELGLTAAVRQEFRQVLDPGGQSVDAAAGQETARAPQTSSAPEALPRALGTPFRSMEESVVNQLAERLNTAVRSGTTEIRLTLRPESLGQVQLKIQMDGDIVMAKINVESQQVRQIIESNLQALRNALQEHNLQAGDFDVDVGDRWADRAEEEGTPARGAGPDASGGDGPEGEEGYGPMRAGHGETGRRYGTNTIEYFA